MCDSSALVAAIKLLDWLEVESNSSVLMKKTQNRILKLELRFLIMFLKYTADRCTDYKNLQHLLTRIQDVGKNINKLHSLLVSPMKQQSRCKPCRSLLKGATTVDPFPTDADDGVRHVLDKIKLVRPMIGQVLMKVSTLSGSVFRLSNGLLAEFIERSLLQVLDELLDPQVLNTLLGRHYYLIPPPKQRIRALKKKLGFLKGLTNLTAKKCNEQLDVFNKFFTHVQAIADRAAYIAYSFLTNKMDRRTAVGLVLEVSDLVQKIGPVTPEVREIHSGVLKTMKSSRPNFDTYQMDETVVDFVDSLLDNIPELLSRDITPMDNQIKDLLGHLRSLSHFLKDTKKFANLSNFVIKCELFPLHDPGKPKDLLAHAEFMAIKAGYVIYSLFEAEGTRGSLRKLLRNLESFNKVVHIRRGSHDPDMEKSNSQKIDELGILDLVLSNLKELLKGRRFASLMKHQIQIIQTDLGFLRSFLITIAERLHEHEELKDLWRGIMDVVYQTEYVIDLVAVNEGYAIDQMVKLSIIVEKIKLFKIVISEIRISNKNLCGKEEHEVAKISIGGEFNASKFDEEMIGFKDEQKKILEQLAWGRNQLEIVAVVGMPGLGKTFLAHKTYNHPIIKDQFHIRAWCNISQVYERRKLLANILNQVKDSVEQMSKMTDEELAGELHKCLKGQKYLIVLDDIWDIKAWNALGRSFPNDNMGSRIVFTSRLSELALQAKFPSKIHHLRSFFNTESWELLQKKIFQTESCPSELLEVGQQIAERCNGLPLAVVVAAGLLSKIGKEEERWKEVRDSLSSYILSDAQRQCKDILDFSYRSLPNYLKSCFLYLGAFPEDKEIPVKKLTRLWIAEGFVRENDTNLESIAEVYLMALINRSLVTISKKRSIGGVKTCLVHDLVREFCLVKAKEEIFFKIIEGCGDMSAPSTLSKSNCSSSYNIGYVQRRLFVYDRQGEENWSEYSGLVRSLLFLAYRERPLLANEVTSIIHEFKFLRVLDLICIDLGNSFPEAIKSLVLLRYFAVTGDFGFLPSSIASLRRLETFIVRGIIENVPQDTILKMTKLRHLHIDYFMFSCSIYYLASYFSQLDNLQTMSTLTLLHGNHLKFLGKFPSLKRLNCVFEDLMGSWRGCSTPTLDFLGQLETLNISCSGNIRFPDMFSLPQNIKKLTMSGFRLPWEEISIVGKLPNLKVLKLLSNAFEGEEWKMQDKEFPKLKFLKLKFLDIKRWIAPDDYFPQIEQLILDRCYQLEEIPSCLEEVPMLKKIRVYRCRNSLKQYIEQIVEEQREMGNDELRIEI